MGQSWWRMQQGPKQWASTLRWLCFSDSTAQLAVKEANRVLRQLSLGGAAAVHAALDYAFEVHSQLSLPRTFCLQLFVVIVLQPSSSIVQ